MADLQEGIRNPALLGRASRLAWLLRDRRVRYLGAGALASVVYYLLFALGWLGAGERIPYLVVAVLANLGAAVLTYPAYQRVVWGISRLNLRSFLKFYAVSLWSLLFALVALPLLIEIADVPVMIAQAVIILANPLINYQLHRLWAFRRAAVQASDDEATPTQ